MLGLGLGLSMWGSAPAPGSGGTGGGGTASSFLLDFGAGSYTVGGTSYGSSLSSIPGYSYTRSGSLSVLNNDGAVQTFTANVAPINGYGLHHYDALTNILLHSQAFDNATWTTTAVAATADTTAAPDGTTTADTTTISNASNLMRAALPTTAQMYTFSFFALRGTATDLKYSVYDLTAGADIIAATSYYSQTNGSTFSRIVVAPFTGSTSQTAAYVHRNSATGTAILWQAQCLNAKLPDGGPIVVTPSSSPVTTGAATMQWSMANGTYSVTYTFDDNSTQVVSQTVSSGTFTLQTAPTLNRGRIKKVQV